MRFIVVLSCLITVLAHSPALSADIDLQLHAIADFSESYCADCHQGEDAAGGFDLAKLDTERARDDGPWDSTAWEKAVKRLRARQMPPIDADRPTEAEYAETLFAMESILDQAAETLPQPGRTDTLRRLNRTEYRNAIRDLLAVDIDVDQLLPADHLGHGFDNVTVGELSPVLLSRYITAAQQISRVAMGGKQLGPGGTTIRLPADLTQESHVEGLPLGTRGGTLIKHAFPETGDYEIQLRLMRDRDENIEGLIGTHDIDVLVDRELVHRFTVSPPKTESGWQKDDTLVDANLKKRFHVEAGPHDVGVTFPRKSSSLSEIKRQPFEANFNRHRHPRRAPAIFEVSIVGPFDPQGPGDTPSRRRILGDTKDAESILRRLARQAYRRPVTEDDLQVPMRFFKERSAADGFDAGIEAAVASILVNPHFLFRAETTPPGVSSGTAYRISDLELATRLSFFIWSSLPDERLIRLASANRLHEPKVLRAQVQRMLKDERSQSLVDNFAAQWLYLRNLDSFRPDRRLFPDFDDNLRKAMRRETELSFARILRDDRNVLELIDSNTTFLNERLARHYGIPNVFGSHFREVALRPTNTHRGGLLRHSSILAVTSYATRTSPTIRGNWILENILGTPAPPPPPNVPSLKDKKSTSILTIRERLAEHRDNPACASCHDLMDPVGFALENYDAVGRWRNFDNERPVDASGSLPDGKSVVGIEQLEAGILARPEMFVGTMAEKLLTFALGRGVEHYDAPAIRKVVRGAADKNYCFSSLVTGIASSSPFQMRVAE